MVGISAPPTYGQLQQMPQVSKFINECTSTYVGTTSLYSDQSVLRIFPVLPQNTRVASVDTLLPVDSSPS